MKKKLFLLPMFLLVFSLAACQQGGGEGGEGEPGGGSEPSGGGGSEPSGGGSGGSTEKLTVKLNSSTATVEVGHSVSLMDMNDSTGVTYTHAETGDGEIEVKDANTPGAWLLTGKKAGTVNFKVTATKGTETANATCVVTVTAASGGEGDGGEGEQIPTAGYAAKIGSQVITLTEDPAAQNEGAFANRKQGYKNSVGNVHAGDKIVFYKDGEAYSFVDAAGDNTAAQPPVYNNFVYGSEGGFEIQADVAAENNFYVNLWKANDQGEEWITFFLEGGSSAEHGTKGGGSGGEGQGGQTQSGYGLKIGDTPVLAEEFGDPDTQGRKQYKITAQAFTAGQTFALYDASNGATWVIAIDSYSFGANGDASKVAEYVTKGEGAYTVVQDFTADIYIKLKMNDDQIYFQLAA